eukprot:6646549-Alexandrium_andersonii.AAC.1
MSELIRDIRIPSPLDLAVKRGSRWAPRALKFPRSFPESAGRPKNARLPRFPATPLVPGTARAATIHKRCGLPDNTT